jgi:hypothetical protein
MHELAPFYLPQCCCICFCPRTLWFYSLVVTYHIGARFEVLTMVLLIIQALPKYQELQYLALTWHHVPEDLNVYEIKLNQS